MDDNELEARLRTHLHQRFDTSPVPASLAAAVRDGMVAAPAARVGFSLRARSLQLGWVATLAVVVVGGAFLLYGRVLGPASPGITATPSPLASASAGAERAFIVLPKGGSTPSKPESVQADAIFRARLGDLGLQTFTTATGNAFELYAPADGPSDDDVRGVLAASGELAFVPLPPTVLGATDPQTLVGKPVPAGAVPLFGYDGIASVKRGTTATQGLPTVDLSLTPAATALFADYTTNHSQEYFAIVIDGIVALVPVINEPIPGGEVSITGGGPSGPNPFVPDTRFDVAAAIIVGGRLPDSWQGADVPEIISRDRAIAAARVTVGDGQGVARLVSADLDAQLGDTGWEPVWSIVLDNIPGKDMTSTMKVLIPAIA